MPALSPVPGYPRLGLRDRDDVVVDGGLLHFVHGDSGPVVIGTPEVVAARLADYARAGVDDLSIIPGNDDEASLETVQGLVREVLPRLRDEHGIELG